MHFLGSEEVKWAPQACTIAGVSCAVNIPCLILLIPAWCQNFAPLTKDFRLISCLIGKHPSTFSVYFEMVSWFWCQVAQLGEPIWDLLNETRMWKTRLVVGHSGSRCEFWRECVVFFGVTWVAYSTGGSVDSMITSLHRYAHRRNYKYETKQWVFLCKCHYFLVIL